ncbi:cell wall hydrolase [Magnetovibrio sp. PR-2]|uniref:cell wall hydrolase n=1 Tax=Magnetovibrio sp. PR-2 TaxID=3120356 RepID=UPI002FCDE7C6
MTHAQNSQEDQRNQAVDTLARTIYGEARGETVRGKEAVACVVMNRVKRATARGSYWWGNSVEEVCKKPWQFSCWNENDPNRKKILAIEPGHRVFDTCLRIARRALSGAIEDMTQGATHYHTASISPPWSKGRPACAEVGHHLFYNDIE